MANRAPLLEDSAPLFLRIGQLNVGAGLLGAPRNRQQAEGPDGDSENQLRQHHGYRLGSKLAEALRSFELHAVCLHPNSFAAGSTNRTYSSAL
jgi:hypothetical protein